MIHAFVRVETLGDVADCVALMKRGAVIGVEPVEGGLFGPVKPVRWGEGKNREKSLLVPPVEIDAFVLDYLNRSEIFRVLSVEDCPDIALIERVWRLVNHAAGSWLTRVQIAELLDILAERYGGRVEAQVGYGSPGWEDFVRSGRHVVCWCRPSERELEDIARYGAAGVIVAGSTPWFAGCAGPYRMPNRGFIDYQPGIAPESAWEGSGEATGLSGDWDSVRRFYRLCGLVIDSPDIEALKLPMRAATTYAKKRGLRPQDEAVRPVRVIDRDGAGAWLSQNWGGFVRVDFPR